MENESEKSEANDSRWVWKHGGKTFYLSTPIHHLSIIGSFILQLSEQILVAGLNLILLSSKKKQIKAQRKNNNNNLSSEFEDQ